MNILCRIVSHEPRPARALDGYHVLICKRCGQPIELYDLWEWRRNMALFILALNILALAIIARYK